MTAQSGRDAVIVAAVRTPVGKGKPGGALHGVLPADLLAHSLSELVSRAGVDPADVDDVIAGAVTQVGDQAVNIARNALLGAGFPESVPGTTVDRQCGSSQQAVSFAAQGVIAGAYDIVIAAGVESMSRVPMGSSVLPGSDPFGVGFAHRYAEGLVPQGISAELIAARWNLSRAELDEFSASSHEKAARATKDGLFDNETGPDRGTGHRRDHPTGRPDTLAGLKPAFYSEAVAARFPRSAGTSRRATPRQLSDGGGAAHHQQRGGAQARVAAAGPYPHHHRGGLRSALHADRGDPGDREGAQPARAVACRHRPVRGQRGVRAGGAELGPGTGADLSKTNVNGGAIAIGHPLGASGARIMTTLVNALEQRGGRYGLQTMCEGGGMANATIIESL